ncbi:hypothetical protein ACO0LO_25455 [Undibacterium sp. TJN25]|uniref:hypothetical protein n=1 Tax=Undibacterium sp. TJN25 TaxID=3413056 RepID=UPI003BF25C06
MKNLLHQRMDSEETSFTESYVPIRKQHGENRDPDMGGYDGKGRTSRKQEKTAKAKGGGTDSYAR